MRSNPLAEALKALILVAFYIGLPVTLVAGWITHIVVCIQDESWVLLLAGALAFPIGIVHGIGSWFGLF
jgi:hypothetical protein